MALSRLLLVAVASCAALAATPAAAQTTLKMNIAIAQNSHYGVAIDTFAREIDKRTEVATRSRISTRARSAPSASRSRRCKLARST